MAFGSILDHQQTTSSTVVAELVNSGVKLQIDKVAESSGKFDMLHLCSTGCIHSFV